MKQNFNLIAPFYDSLARGVIGTSIIDSQVCFLNRIPADSDILIVGGGTGWILNKILVNCDNPCISYVESSSSMMERSKKACLYPDRVDFKYGDLMNLKLKQYDVIITFYFLDVFPADSLEKVVTFLDGHLRRGGLWLYTDFRKTNKPSHELLIYFMLLFFRIIASLNTRKLVDHARLIDQNGFVRKDQKMFKDGMIRSILFRKSLAV